MAFVYFIKLSKRKDDLLVNIENSLSKILDLYKYFSLF